MIGAVLGSATDRDEATLARRLLPLLLPQPPTPQPRHIAACAHRDQTADLASSRSRGHSSVGYRRSGPVRGGVVSRHKVGSGDHEVRTYDCNISATSAGPTTCSTRSSLRKGPTVASTVKARPHFRVGCRALPSGRTSTDPQPFRAPGCSRCHSCGRRRGRAVCFDRHVVAR